MIKGIEHVGIAVKSLDEALRFYRDVLELSIASTGDGPRYKTAFAPAGEAELEFLEDLSPQGIIARHIERRGEGFQHLALTVDDLELTLEELRKKGIMPIADGTAPNIPRLVAWLHPRSTHGVLIELCDKRYRSEREKRGR